ncbi:MAG: CocE/NonD family hydrolase [Gammaproteobacteria bacterium]|nr:CocE/NonD family hydrolase [Gammaproteobacteria bacterium]
MKKILSSIVLMSLIAISAPAHEVDEQEKYGVRVEKSHMVEMRDGVHLSMDLYMPEGATGKLPTILLRTPYNKNIRNNRSAEYQQSLVAKGYVLAIVDMRGRFESEGRYKPAVGGREDAYDTVTWITEQPWSNKKVGTMGCSYLGDTQVVLATTRHPNHLAAVPMAPATGYLAYGRPWQAFDGGVFELAQTAGWFSGSGSEVVYGPPPWVDRQEWFRSDAAKLFSQVQDRDQIEYFSYVRTLPIIDILQKSGAPPTDYENFVSNNPDSEYFRKLHWATSSDRFDTPMLFVDAWYDYGMAETLELWNIAQKNSVSRKSRDNQYIIIAPTTHCVYSNSDGSERWVVGERDMGTAGLDFIDIQNRWYDHWLKDVDNGITDMPRVQYFLMGRNEWRSSDVWPLADTNYTKFYLHSGGHANSRFGDGKISETAPSGEQPADDYVYDPATPVPSIGGQACCTGLDTGAGAYDQSNTEMRQDVLVYTSDVLEQGLNVTGPLEVVLYVSSSARDTDFMAKLVDVYPDGRAFNVQEGALRMRYREGFDKDLRMREGEVYEARLDLHATANYFGPGHRVRLEVSSSSFPRFDRNLNTGGNNYDESEWVIAENSVHHSAEYPSHLLLPVIE